MAQGVPNEFLISLIIEMAHQSPHLEYLAFQSNSFGNMTGPWSLMDLICNISKLDRPLYTWPQLLHLELRYFHSNFWSTQDHLRNLENFLATHDRLETLILRDSPNHFGHLSLLQFPNALPRLRRLHGPFALIVGVIESTRACASLKYIFDTVKGGYLSNIPDQARFFVAFQNAGPTQLKRLRISTATPGLALFVDLARVAPNLEFIELISPNTNSYDEDGELVVSAVDQSPIVRVHSRSSYCTA
jgi:hypothetical protein